MNKLLRKTSIKVIAVLVFAMTMTATFFGLGSILVLEHEGAYENYNDKFVENYMLRIAEDRTITFVDEMYNAKKSDYPTAKENWMKTAEEDPYTGYMFIVKDSKGKTIFSNYDKAKESKYSYLIMPFGEPVKVYVEANPESTSDAAKNLKFANKAYESRNVIAGLTLIAFAISAALLVFLMCGAGRRIGREEIRKRLTDKIPADLYTALTIAIIAGYIATLYWLVEDCFNVYVNIMSVSMTLMLSAVIVFSGCALGMVYLMAIAVQIKTGTLVRGTLIYRCFSAIKKIVYALPYIWRVLAISCAVVVVNLFIAVAYGYGPGIFKLFVIETLLLGVLICYGAYNMNKLKEAGEAIANGDTDYKVDTSKMLYDFKRHGENLNSINNSVSVAVEKQMKSERMKTELITNVSHDIKTPLTSIISYIELLKKEETDKKQAKEYIGILDKQALKLKKLTEDLVEASKASTGNLKVELKQCNMAMLLDQAIGEYQDKFEKLKLKPVVTKEEEDINIMADGKHMWRIIDNLFSNICKYAQEGTRVYMDVYKSGNKAVLSLKNISREELNITAEELVQRFVRGDVSRNTEGSGLGLSIAKNLATLQKGKLDIQIDGDLFKASIEFEAQ